MSNKLIDAFIEHALEEDLGDGDHTSLACIQTGTKGKAQLLVKQKGILAGVTIAEQIFRQLDPQIKFENKIKNGSSVNPGDVAFIVEGDVIKLLQAERLVLNIMQRMCGIATQTAEYVARLEGLKTQVLDTRKTTPGMRLLDKEAVKTGGGKNHRIGLYDMILIKDNHIDFSGGIPQAIQRTKNYLKEKKKSLKIEVEVRTLEDIEIILHEGGVDFILLDNFSLANTRKAVELIAGRCQTESSGGITLENLRDYAECGVDFISVGALTHQIKSLDLSLKAIS